jgi:glycine/D-amino acid oxidase-like deaminating enzyme
MTAGPTHAVVVGAGAFGVASALELRRRAWSVTMLDSGPVPNEAAASTDVSKVVRMDYGSDVFYHELAEAALDGWDRWNADWPRPLYHEDGFLILSREPMRPGGFEHESWRVLRERGHAPERIGGRELERRHPAWSGADYPDGYFNPRGGWAESGAVVMRLVELARTAGVELRSATCERILSAGSRVSGVAVATGERLDADAVVVSAGAWTPGLLPWLSDTMWPTAQPVVHLRVEDPGAFRGDRFPPWAADIAGSGWYGFPALADGTLKVAHHGPGTRTPPDRRGVVADEHVDRVRSFLRSAVPGAADAPVVARRVCMYCDSFDGDFLIDRDPLREGLVVASGDSGHGFKFTPVIGAIVADAVEGRPNRWGHRFRWRSPSGRVCTEEGRFRG